MTITNFRTIKIKIDGVTINISGSAHPFRYNGLELETIDNLLNPKSTDNKQEQHNQVSLEDATKAQHKAVIREAAAKAQYKAVSGVVSEINKNNGILISLDPNDIDVVKMACKNNGLAYLNIPIIDFSAPSINDFNRVYSAVVQAVTLGTGNKGKNVAIHCGEGYGRTGTMLAGVVLMSELNNKYKADRQQFKQNYNLAETATIKLGEYAELAAASCSQEVKKVIEFVRLAQISDASTVTHGQSVETAEQVESLCALERAIVADFQKILKEHDSQEVIDHNINQRSVKPQPITINITKAEVIAKLESYLKDNKEFEKDLKLMDEKGILPFASRPQAPENNKNYLPDKRYKNTNTHKISRDAIKMMLENYRYVKFKNTEINKHLQDLKNGQTVHDFFNNHRKENDMNIL